MEFCTSVDFRFWLLRFSGVQLTVPLLCESQCSRTGGPDSKDYLQKSLWPLPPVGSLTSAFREGSCSGLRWRRSERRTLMASPQDTTWGSHCRPTTRPELAPQRKKNPAAGSRGFPSLNQHNLCAMLDMLCLLMFKIKLLKNHIFWCRNVFLFADMHTWHQKIFIQILFV